VEAIKENEIKSLSPSAFKSSEDSASGPVFDSILFRQDVVDNVDSRGKVEFKRSWAGAYTRPLFSST
jgi:hypothetical protein